MGSSPISGLKMSDKKKDRRPLRHINIGAVFLAHQQGIVKGTPIHIEIGNKVNPLDFRPMSESGHKWNLKNVETK